MHTQNTVVHIDVWHKDFWLMVMSTFLLSASVYIQIPALSERLPTVGLSPVETGAALGALGIGMFLFGPLCSFLVQRFRRNMVCVWAIAGMMATELGQMYADRFEGSPEFALLVIALRFVQGACFGLAQMVLCSTLIIDTTESFQRTEANHIASWFARFSLPLGPLAGYYSYELTGFDGSVIASLACAFLAIVFISMVKFPFKAPGEDTRLFRLDRFFLPQGALLFANLAVVTTVAGLLLSMPPQPLFFAMLFAGLCLAVISGRFVFRNAELKSEVITGLIIMAASVLAMLTRTQAIVSYMSPLLLGCGIGIIGARFLLFFIKLSRHCQRGTSQSTFILGWESGIAIGLFVGHAAFEGSVHGLLSLALCILAFAFVLYNFITHKWFMANKNR